MSTRIAVFHPGVQHSYETALAFQEAGRLAWFATSIFFVPNRWPYRLAMFAPPRVRRQLEHEFRRRFHPLLDPQSVRTFGLCEWIERIGMRLNMRRVEHYANEIGNVLFGRRVGRLAVADQVGVVWGYDTASLSAFRRARRRGIRCVLEQTIGHPREWNQLLIEERARVGEAFDPYPRPYPEKDLALVDAEHALADRIVCGSEFVRETLVKRGVRAHIVNVVTSGATLDAFSPAERRREGPELRLLFAGHFGIRKGAWYLLEAMRALKSHRRITLTIVGKRTVPDRYLDEFDRITVLPHVSRGTMADVYRQHDVFILPTLFEGSSIAIFEALACGVPVITTPNAGSIVRDGVEGFIVPVRDAKALAERIETLDADRGRLAEFSAAARTRALEFPWSAYRRALVSLIEEWDRTGWA